MGKRIELTNEQENIIIYHYVDLQESAIKSGKAVGVSDAVVKRVLYEHNIPLRTINKPQQKFTIKKDFFKNQTKDMAYVLGLLASDGSVSASKNLIYIELQRADRELLEKVNKILENTRPVKDYETSRGYENSKIYFYSQEAKEQLKEYHIIPNKTNSTEFTFPETLRKEFWNDYIRGLFDGGGCIKDTNGTPTWEINSVSKNLIDVIQQYFLDLGIEMKIQTFSKNRNMPVYRLYCYSQEKCHKIFNILYNNTELYLNRKKQKFINLLK